jgi:hypothetical protein
VAEVINKINNSRNNNNRQTDTYYYQINGRDNVSTQFFNKNILEFKSVIVSDVESEASLLSESIIFFFFPFFLEMDYRSDSWTIF